MGILIRAYAQHRVYLLPRYTFKAMEYEAILGNAIKIVHRHKIPIPRLETLYSLLKLISAD